MEISDYAHYVVLLLLLLKRNLWLRSLRCFTSLTMLTTLSLFTTVKMKSLTALTTLLQFTITKMKYLNTLTMVFLLSLLLKWYLWLRSLHCFTFTALKMKSLTTLTTLFCFITTNPKDRTILTTLLLSLIHQITQEFQCSYKICMCHSNFTVRKFSGVLHALLPKPWCGN